MFVDGGRTTKSKNFQIWPIVATVVELPPLLRNSYRNAIWLCIWYSTTSKPNWNLMVKLIKTEIGEQLLLNVNENIFEVNIIIFFIVNLD